MAAFEVDRRDLAERGVPPARVVEALDEVEDGHLRLGLRLEAFAVEKLALERREEALRRARCRTRRRPSPSRVGHGPPCSAARTRSTCMGEFKRSSQHLEEELRWRQSGAEERIELYVDGCVHQAVRRWDAASIGRGSGKRSLEVCRARRPPWRRVCPPLSGHAGFANVVACHPSIFVPSRGAISRSLSEKRSPFFEPVVVACARSPGSWPLTLDDLARTAAERSYRRRNLEYRATTAQWHATRPRRRIRRSRAPRRARGALGPSRRGRDPELADTLRERMRSRTV